MTITQVTRRALANVLRAEQWCGDLTELSLLERLYDLRLLPSEENRGDAWMDIWQHTVNNPGDWDGDWPLWDRRLEMDSDERLLQFLAATVHPEVRPDDTDSARLAEAYNEHLRLDGIELGPAGELSGRPVYRPRPASMKLPTAKEFRETFIEAVWSHIKAQNVEALCERLGFQPSGAFGDYEDPFNSKRGYVQRRIAGRSIEELLPAARQLVDETDDDELTAMVAAVEASAGGVAGVAKYLVFAADGPKPDFVMDDMINADIKFIEALHCLVYDRPIEDHGLTWRDLVTWWGEKHPDPDERQVALQLYGRLKKSLAANSPGEHNMLFEWARMYRERGWDIPALLPQVYLHMDPRAARIPADSPLTRQRMDFLLLLPGRRRVVLEVDGQHHYADDGRANSEKYAEMVREDRRLRLGGYEVYRFGAVELNEKEKAQTTLTPFFEKLLAVSGFG